MPKDRVGGLEPHRRRVTAGKIINDLVQSEQFEVVDQERRGGTTFLQS